jgi:outer membrane protein OmpA-like peptidoglycan-associated protein
MKNIVVLTVIIALLTFHTTEVKSQVKDPVKQTEKEGEHRVNRGIDKTIDKGFDKLEEGIGGLFKKGKKNRSDKGEAAQEQEQAGDTKPSDAAIASSQQQSGPALNWAKYDFVPGDQVIFEDNQLGEENGEFPSRWDLIAGNTEIANFDGENVIMMRDGSPSIVPYFKDPGEDHLPEVFTIELDLYYPKEYPFQIYLYDRKNQKSNSPTGYTYITVKGNEMSMGRAASEYPEEKELKRWMHIAIAYTDGKLKAYLDDTRLINIPRLDFNPSGLTLHAYHASNENICYIKNVRIAKGGVKYYDRFLQDGKIIANGIRFDVNKATLKPESMGIINEIAALMNEHPEITFSVEGHTDSDGDDALNQTLSEQRAATVASTLTKMGVNASRLTSKGWGETKPLDTNATPEGKANNRRVEFVRSN